MPGEIGESPVAFDRPDSRAERVEDTGTVLVPAGAFCWVVALLDGEGDHMVRLYRDKGRLLGGCDCKGWEYNPGPCAHLWAVYMAATASDDDPDHEALAIREVEAAVGSAPTCPICGTEQVPGGEP